VCTSIFVAHPAHVVVLFQRTAMSLLFVSLLSTSAGCSTDDPLSKLNSCLVARRAEMTNGQTFTTGRCDLRQTVSVIAVPTSGVGVAALVSAGVSQASAELIMASTIRESRWCVAKEIPASVSATPSAPTRSEREAQVQCVDSVLPFLRVTVVKPSQAIAITVEKHASGLRVTSIVGIE
jgi:hypothetical protein